MDVDGWTASERMRELTNAKIRALTFPEIRVSPFSQKFKIRPTTNGIHPTNN